MSKRCENTNRFDSLSDENANRFDALKEFDGDNSWSQWDAEDVSSECCFKENGEARNCDANVVIMPSVVHHGENQMKMERDIKVTKEMIKEKAHFGKSESQKKKIAHKKQSETTASMKR